MTDADLFDAFSTMQQARAFSPATIKRRRLSLSRFARFIAPSSVLTATSADVDDWLSKLNTAKTIHAYCSDLRVFYDWSVRRGHTMNNPMLAVDNVRVPKSVPKPVPADVIAAAFTIATGRVQMALMLGALAGLRLGEMVALDAGDIHLDAEPPILVVRNGKGGKDRVVPLHPTLRTMLRGRTGWIFGHKNAGWGAGPITANQLAREVAGTLTRASGGKRYSTHSLRHFFGTEAARWSGGNVVLVQALMGHETPQTTIGYIGWTPTEGAEVVAKITPGPIDDELAERRRRNVS